MLATCSYDRTVIIWEEQGGVLHNLGVCIVLCVCVVCVCVCMCVCVCVCVCLCSSVDFDC